MKGIITNSEVCPKIMEPVVISNYFDNCVNSGNIRVDFDNKCANGRNCIKYVI